LSDFAAAGYLIIEMQSKSDAQLLREYAELGIETAFTEIVTRHTDLVYSAALRQVHSPDIASDIAQSVFISLARGARSLSARLNGDASLAGWLCRGARNLSLNHRRDEFRRHSHARLAMEDLNPNSDSTADWDRLRPVLDDVMAELDELDYEALVLRFFRNQDLRAVGRALGVSDDTAQKRVARALEKLRVHLSRRGITTTAAALPIALTANAVQAAPAGLAAAISTAAALTGTFVQSSTALAVTKTIAMTTIQKALTATVFAAAVGTGIYEIRRANSWQEQALSLQLREDSLAAQNLQLQTERDLAARNQAASQAEAVQSRGNLSELLKLRADVAKLRRDSRELAQLKAAASAARNDPKDSESQSALDRVNKLRQRLGQMPDQRIPELQFLSEQDWLNAVKGMSQLDTDSDFDRALRELRNSAKKEFAALVQNALGNYVQANNGQLPASMAQLNSYFSSPLDDSLLPRYDLTSAGVVVEKSTPLDDTYYQISLTGVSEQIGSVAENILQQALQAYSGANNGQKPGDPEQLLPYATTPAQKAVLQRIIQNPSLR